jgi:hypothetical protein
MKLPRQTRRQPPAASRRHIVSFATERERAGHAYHRLVVAGGGRV